MPGTDENPIPGTQRLRVAAGALHAGGIVAHPTEGVWGLACDPLNPDAVLKLLAAKNRDIDKGLIVVAHQPDLLAPFVAEDAEAWQRACATWPGPSTWLLPAHPATPDWLTGTHDRIALRVTAHPVAAALCRVFGGALVSTSANVSNKPAALHAWQVRNSLGKYVEVIIGGHLQLPGQPSTITDAVTGTVIRGPSSNEQHR